VRAGDKIHADCNMVHNIRLSSDSVEDNNFFYGAAGGISMPPPPPHTSGLHRFLFSDKQDRQIFGICQAPSPYPSSILVPTFTLSITADRKRLSREIEMDSMTADSAMTSRPRDTLCRLASTNPQAVGELTKK